ncbi:Laccase-1 [Acorus calamus]|uniref:laccase n=1 Tax=Acorus calamus TaxID=4465 RepID=A0AAV9F557_ACOCL|nr:Laccase-1 [Acorus calamus]
MEGHYMSGYRVFMRLLTVNGEYPGPTIDVREGDRVEVVVFNNVEHNTTIHWFVLPILLTGEWWNADTEAIESDTIRYGSGPNVSNAYTINGMPGPYYPCSNQDTFTHIVEHGKTYMLRIINAALNHELFFAVENHTLTVVEIDATYVNPFVTSAIMIAPGQTTSALVTTNTKPGTFMLAARPYVSATIPINPTTAIGFISYSTNQVPASREHGDLTFLPPMRDTAFATQFSNNLRSLDSTEHPCKVPKEVDKRLFITISLNLQDCCLNCICKGFAGKRFSASMNNQSFTRPATSILESYFKNTMDAKLINSFPERPPHPFNYTGPSTLDMKLNTEFGMRLVVVPHGTRLEFVLQDTSLVNAENHPIHVHGHNFFVVGRGFGNFEEGRDRAGFNLVDPPERNTVAVPSGGWAAIRFKADNPGMWFVHCHLETHTTWGLAMGFIVRDGPKASQQLLPPPEDLPPC